MNRALQSQYAPGLGVQDHRGGGRAAGGLAHADGPDRTATASSTWATWTFKDWKEGGHGHVDLRRRIAQSCNIFFYQAGLKVGRRPSIAKYAQAFGLGSPTGIDLRRREARAGPVLARPARSAPGEPGMPATR